MSDIFLGLSFAQGIAIVSLALCFSVLGWGIGTYGKLWSRDGFGDHVPPAVFVFQHGVLEDANPQAHSFLATNLGNTHCDWASLSKQLTNRFTDIPAALGSAHSNETKSHAAQDLLDPSFLTIEQWGPRARVTLFEQAPKSLDDTEELKSERNKALEQAPNPVWHSSNSGEITWANTAYCDLAKTLGRDLDDGFPILFSDLPAASNKEPRRTALPSADQRHSYWFDVTSVTVKRGQTHYAIDANAIVNAEVAQRNFVQTLTKTFAQLSIGLALFDRNRQLALFNPALIDLTFLPADFLSSRPNFLTFFDKLRENRVMPEPKNYSSWREQISELVVAAADDRYSETWTLPSGVTYRVVGRPHPDGAIALLFEDISAEVSLTRRFRAELELGQSILDALESPLAVFSPTGSMTFCNRAYQRFWKDNPCENLSDYSIDLAIHNWKSQSDSTIHWPEVRQHMRTLHREPDMKFALKMKSGRPVKVTISNVHGGASLVLFQVGTPNVGQKKTSEKLVV